MIEDFAHRLTLDRIRDGERIDLVADDAERQTIAQRLDPGQTLTLQLVATTTAYAKPRLGGEVTFERIVVELPVAEGLTEG